MSNYKTTVSGIVAFLAVLAPQIQKLFDNDAATNPDWNLIVAAGAALLAAIFAKDAEKKDKE